MKLSQVSGLLAGRSHYFRRKSAVGDAAAGVTLGVVSVPDAMAAGVLAGVNPIYALYAVMLATPVGALFASSALMSVQTTGAMSLLVYDVPAVHQGDDPSRALFTLALLTGVLMLAAGLARLGSVLRFVSNAVMVGFINGVAVLIILGQLGDLTGSSPEGGNRVRQTFDLFLNPGQIQLRSLAVGLLAILLIVVLTSTRLRSFGMVAALAVASVAVPLFSWEGVSLVRDIADIPGSLPRPVLPSLAAVPDLLIPAVSLAFVGLVQGAGISQNYENPDGRLPQPSGDFVGQGAANVAAGLFQGMPVGGSLSATALVKGAGARTRFANISAGIVIAVVLLVFGDAVGRLAMPALAGLLIVIGFQTLKPRRVRLVWHTGMVQRTVMATTFALTLLLPLQYAVLAGVGLSVVLFVVRQSNRVVLKRMIVRPGQVPVEEDPPEVLGEGDFVVLVPYGSLFFAAAHGFEDLLPKVSGESHRSVVVLVMRGRTQIGSTLAGSLRSYAAKLAERDSTLMLADVGRALFAQMEQMGVVDDVGVENIFVYQKAVGASALNAVQAAQERTAVE